MLKKNFFLILIASLALTACAPKTVVLRPDDLNNQDSGATFPAGIPAGIKCQDPLEAVIWETDKDSGFQYEKEIKLCNGHTAANLTTAGGFEVATFAMMALADGPELGPADVVAVTALAGRVAIVWLTAATAAVIAQKTGVVALIGHSDPNHDTRADGSVARRFVTKILTIWSFALSVTGNPPPEVRCGAIKSGKSIIRIVVWVADASMRAGRGMLAWYDVATQQWGGAYVAPQEKFEKGPSTEHLTERGWTWAGLIDCPKSLPELQPATH